MLYGMPPAAHEPPAKLLFSADLSEESTCFPATGSTEGPWEPNARARTPLVTPGQSKIHVRYSHDPTQANLHLPVPKPTPLMQMEILKANSGLGHDQANKTC